MPLLPLNRQRQSTEGTVYPTRRKISYFGDILPSQSLGLVLEKLNPAQ